jgi:hypothetical protein
MSKEKFEDNNYYLAKGLYHIQIAKEYYEMLRLDAKYSAKDFLNNWLNKLSFLTNDVLTRLTKENADWFRNEVIKGDNIFFDAVAEKLIHLNPQQKQQIELIINGMIAGEEIKFVTENNY